MIYIENTTVRTEKSADYLGNAGFGALKDREAFKAFLGEDIRRGRKNIAATKAGGESRAGPFMERDRRIISAINSELTNSANKSRAIRIAARKCGVSEATARRVFYEKAGRKL